MTKRATLRVASLDVRFRDFGPSSGLRLFTLSHGILSPGISRPAGGGGTGLGWYGVSDVTVFLAG